MKRAIKCLGLPVLMMIPLIMSFPFQSCDIIDDPDPGVMDKKPNIYIYPEEAIHLNVKLSFPLGGRIVTSIPEYGTGWSIEVDTNGIIDGVYEYLYYESLQPDVWQKTTGWLVEKSKLEQFFKKNLTDYGFYGRELSDFTDYWIPRLTDSDFYVIYPQESEIVESVIGLDFSTVPDNILRLHYLIRESEKDSNTDIIEPEIRPFKREGFFVTEWGVIL